MYRIMKRYIIIMLCIVMVLPLAFMTGCQKEEAKAPPPAQPEAPAPAQPEAPGYGAPSGGYGAPGYGEPSGGYGAPPGGGYGAPPTSK